MASIDARAAATTIPIVFTTSADPVQLGLVASLSRPGGHVTGAATLNLEVGPKRLELIHQALPAATRIAMLRNPASLVAADVSRELSAAAAKYGLRRIVNAGTEEQLEAAFAMLAREKTEALVIGSDVFFSDRSVTLGKLAYRYQVPAIYQYPDFTMRAAS